MKKNFKKKVLALTLAMSMVVTNLMLVSAEETPKNTNLALNKTVTASAEYSTLPKSYLTDADKESRWSTENAPTEWAYVDLGSTQEMNYFSMIWESSSVYAGAYNIYVSDSTDNWGTPVVAQTGNKDAQSENYLETPVSGRYVKLEVTQMMGYQSVSCRDFTIMYKDGRAQDPAANVAAGKLAVASSQEADSVRAALAVDGDTTSRTSRWGSDVGAAPHWIYVDLGEEMDVKTVRIFWENRKATDYEIQTATNLDEWTTQKSVKDRPATTKDTITLEEAVKARYVRLLINNFTAADPDGGVEWNSVSIFEMEVYGGAPVSTVDPTEAVSVKTPAKDDKKLEVTIEEVDGYEIVYNGTDYEQIVDKDLTIYQPLVDTKVKVSFKITETATGDYQFVEKAITIPGTYTKEAGDNAALTVVPELREWKGSTGKFAVKDSARIVYDNDALKAVAEVFAEDYAEIMGKDITVVKGSSANAGDYFFTLTSDKSLGLKEEGYLMEIEDSITVTAENTTGAYWATRTILQSLVLDATGISKGITRDYPLYKVRGYILDVGRKTFTMDHLEEVVNMMSWYKMNDFQVHLNDNLIPLEHYSQIGEDPMKAYSAFRLESDIKEGGNNGLNKADLTSKDVFYTKDEFKSFIKDARVRGVNIIPEIDVPAHSLALTKVRPDLRYGTYGRDNDHLDLKNQYDECLEFVLSIFNEYMGNDLADPTFDEDTIVHIGADEYTAAPNAYRQFANDMMDYVQDTGRTVRIWGSLTSIKGDVDVRGDRNLAATGERAQMNLWNFGWANIDQMYELGFDLINCNDGNYYIVPNAGYYYDYLNNNVLYNLDINTIGGITIPAGDEQMVGGAFAVWNDMTDYLDNGVSEWDVYDRIKEAVPLFGAKLWGKQDATLDEVLDTAKELGDGPGTNFNYEVPVDEDGVIGEYLVEEEAIELKGGEDFVETDLTTVGLGNDLRVKVKRTSDSKEDQILFESSYGSIKAVQGETGKVGFTRENFDYSFNYELPVNEWVELEFKNAKNTISLYVNGKLVDTLGDGEKVEGRPLLATTMFPVERIGSKTNAFIGLVDDVRLGVNDTFASTMELDYAVEIAEIILATEKNDALAALVADAQAVIEKYDPTAEEVAELVDAIHAELEKVDYEEADYSRVDAYISLVGDLSAYTEESANVLQRAVDAVRSNLPVEQQEVVDGYEAQIASALAGLTLKEKANANFIDNADLSATASSYQDNGSAPDKVLDNDADTMWHSQWSITTMPHWLQLSFKGEAQAVNGLTYVPRQSGNDNGVLTKYEILGSNDGQNFETIKTGTLAANKDAKEITFDRVTYKHIRIKFVEAVGNNGSASAVLLHAADVQADKAGLTSVLDGVKAVKDAGFTTESWDALQAKIAEAETLLAAENADPEAVEQMKTALVDAKMSLVLAEKVVDPDQPEEPPVVTVDKTVAQKYYDDCTKYYKEADYTEASWAAYADAMATLKGALADEAVTKEALQAAVDAVEAAAEKLEKPAVDPENPTDPEEPKDPAVPEKPEKPEIPDTPSDDKEEDKSPATGDSASMMVWFMMMFVAGAVLVVRRKRVR